MCWSTTLRIKFFSGDYNEFEEIIIKSLKEEWNVAISNTNPDIEKKKCLEKQAQVSHLKTGKGFIWKCYTNSKSNTFF